MLTFFNFFLSGAGDVLSGTSGAGKHYTGVLEEWAGGATWWNERTFVLFTITVVILLPLVSFRHVGTSSVELPQV
jgi:sodium-coupled neutral amino acid transporter 2